MSTRVSALALCGLLAGCGPAAAPPPVDQPVAAAQPAQPAPATPATKPGADGKVSLMPAINSPAPAQESPLTQEEIDLIAADPVTLSPEMRRKRAFALRRKIMQNPDSPTARQLEALRIAAEKGELQPQLPDKKGDDKGVTLHARDAGAPTPDARTDRSAPTPDAKTDKSAPTPPAPAKAP